MACETFVVATDCGGVKEVMGDTGILVPPKSSDALAQAIFDAINLPTENICQNNAKALQQIKQNFDLTQIVQQWLEIYEKS